jgi:hypothetical protein
MPVPQSLNVDHLVYVTGSVDKTVDDLSLVLGVTPLMGGQHPAWGTRNALVALGPRSYLEVMGPEPTLSRPGLQRPFGMEGLAAPRLATWVSASADLAAVMEAARKAGVDLGEILQGSRTRSDGTVLAWRMTDLMARREGGIIPYFIDWGHSPHPAESAPQGCTLLELNAEHPDPPRIRSLLSALGLDLPIKQGVSFRLKAVVQSKKGLVELA